MNILADIWDTICTTLLPRLEEALEEPLTAKLKQLAGILEIVQSIFEKGSEVIDFCRQEPLPFVPHFSLLHGTT